MMAKALENSGAIVYILGRRQNKLEAAAKDNNVRVFFLWTDRLLMVMNNVLFRNIRTSYQLRAT